MGALSDVLRVIRLAGAVFLEAQVTAPLCISGKVSTDVCKAFQVAPRHIIASHFVAEGRMQLKVQGWRAGGSARWRAHLAATQRRACLWQ